MVPRRRAEPDLGYTDSDSETVTIRLFRMTVDIRFGSKRGMGTR